MFLLLVVSFLLLYLLVLLVLVLVPSCPCFLLVLVPSRPSLCSCSRSSFSSFSLFVSCSFLPFFIFYVPSFPQRSPSPLLFPSLLQFSHSHYPLVPLPSSLLCAWSKSCTKWEEWVTYNYIRTQPSLPLPARTNHRAALTGCQEPTYSSLPINSPFFSVSAASTGTNSGAILVSI